MNFQDLLRKVDVEKVFKAFLPLVVDFDINDSKYSEGIFKFKKLFIERYNDFVNRDIIPNTDEYLVCIRYLETFPEYIDGVFKDEYDYSVSIVKPNKNFDFYSLTFVPWSKILGTPVFSISLDRYGKEFVVASILDEMFEFSMDEEEKISSENRLSEQLEAAMKEVDESKYIPVEEVFKEFHNDDYYNSEEYKTKRKHADEIIRKNTEIQDEFIERLKESIC